MKRVLIILSILFLVSFCIADDHVAASLSQADIQAAVDAADPGDRVVLPAGTNASYTGTVTITDNNIHMIGAGSTNTIIQMADNSCDGRYNPMFNFDTTTGCKFSGIQLQGFKHLWHGSLQFDECTEFEIYDCHIHTSCYYCIMIAGYPSAGVIHNCTIGNSFIEGQGLGYGVAMYGYNRSNEANGDYGDASWGEAVHYGAAGRDYVTYIEDCEISDCRHLITGQLGARFVLRYNDTLLNCTEEAEKAIDTHGCNNTGRGARTYEVYENTAPRTDNGNITFFVFMAGDGVVYNNTITGLSEQPKWGYLGHPCCGAIGGDNCLEAFDITYTGAGDPATMTITGDPATALSTTCTGAAGDNLSIDLTHANYDTFEELSDYIHAQANYTCTVGSEAFDEEASSKIRDVTDVNILVAYTAEHDKPIRDQVSSIYLWGNSVNGGSYNSIYIQDNCLDNIDQPYFVEDEHWFQAEKGGYTPMDYPHPMRARLGIGGGKTSTGGGSITIKKEENGGNGHSYSQDVSRPVRAPYSKDYIGYVTDVFVRASLNVPQQYWGTIPSKHDVEDPPFSVGPRAYGTSFSMAGGAYPSDFDWRSADDGQSCITSIKDQQTCAVCWAFATLACFEAQIMIPSNGSVGNPADSFNLSEEFMKECNVLNPGCHGSDIHHPLAVLTTKGAVLENCDPIVYSDSPPCNPNDCPERFVVTGYRLVGSTEAEIKQAIYDYGPVYTNMQAGFWIDANTNSLSFMSNYDGTCACHTDVAATNHTAIIIGWEDDSLDICDDGAYPGSLTDYWICKNSYGTEWGGSGVFYMDTDADWDAQVGSGAWRISDWELWDENRVIYYYDEGGWQAPHGYSGQGGDETIAYGLVKFTATGKQVVYAVGFYIPTSAACNYNIYLYDGFDGTDLGNQLTTQNASLSVAGYYTVYLTSPQEFEVGDTIVMVVKLDFVTYEYPVVCDDTDTIYGADIETAKTYMSQTGASGTWTDMGDVNSVDVGIRVLARYAGKVKSRNVTGTGAIVKKEQQ